MRKEAGRGQQRWCIETEVRDGEAEGEKRKTRVLTLRSNQFYYLTCSEKDMHTERCTVCTRLLTETVCVCDKMQTWQR